MYRSHDGVLGLTWLFCLPQISFPLMFRGQETKSIQASFHRHSITKGWGRQRSRYVAHSWRSFSRRSRPFFFSSDTHPPLYSWWRRWWWYNTDEGPRPNIIRRLSSTVQRSLSFSRKQTSTSKSWDKKEDWLDLPNISSHTTVYVYFFVVTQQLIPQLSQATFWKHAKAMLIKQLNVGLLLSNGVKRMILVSHCYLFIGRPHPSISLCHLGFDLKRLLVVSAHR